MKPSDSTPLNEREFDRLESLLNAFGEDSMTLEMVDGFFAALICGPELVTPDEWLPVVLGDRYSSVPDNKARETLTLLIRHWNTIADTLEGTLDDDSIVYLPVLSLDEEDGIAYANEWAAGFMIGIDMRHESWKELIDDEESALVLSPVFMLGHEHDEDPKLRTGPIAPDERDAFIELMTTGLTLIYLYFDERRQQNALRDAQEPMRRESAKIGRNEPCPCGSGRKYKQCCGATG